MRSWISSSRAGASASGTSWRVSHAGLACRGGVRKRTCDTGPSTARYSASPKAGDDDLNTTPEVA